MPSITAAEAQRVAWDYIVVGGGLAGSVVAHRLRHASAAAAAAAAGAEERRRPRVLVVEAGPDVRGREDILYAPGLSLMGGDLDWRYRSAPQEHLGGRRIDLAAGKALGGGTVINVAGWLRGDRTEYDEWGELVGDARWSYAGQLPYMRRTERLFSNNRHNHGNDHPESGDGIENKTKEKKVYAEPARDQHGYDGPVHIQSITSTDRRFPLRERALRAWADVGIGPAGATAGAAATADGEEGALDGNAGSPLGVAELQENRRDGRRQIAPETYSLADVDVLTGALVRRVLLEGGGSPGEEEGGEREPAEQDPRAVGIQLADGTEIRTTTTTEKGRGGEVILSAGAYRTPQALMLSGIGPAAHLREMGVAAAGVGVVVDSPDVGANLADHPLTLAEWRVRDPSAGWVLGSANPLFRRPQYAWGYPSEFVVTADVPKDGLRRAIAEDAEGANGPEDVDPATHPLLSRPRAFVELVLMYAGSALNSAREEGEGGGEEEEEEEDNKAAQQQHQQSCTFIAVNMLTTSRGTVRLASGSDPAADPVVDPRLCASAVDRYVAREALRLQARFAAGDRTEFGREVFDGELVPGGGEGEEEKGLTPESSDEYLDARVRAGVGSIAHPMGTAAMGKVVDADLRVKGVRALRVVDASVFPVCITGHLQVATYALAEQAADIIISAARGG